MARARNIKPGIFKNELLGVADPLLTILFESLWCLADREGRLEDRPLRIKAETFPYRENIKIVELLDWLQSNGFIVRYKVRDQALIQIVNFKKHQTPHNTERPSELPERITEVLPLNNGEVTQALPPDSLLLIPDSLLLIPDSGIPISSPPSLASDSEIPSEFEEAWLAYPKRSGASKKDSLKAWKARIKAGESAEIILAGVKRYSDYVLASNTEDKFIKQPTTFFGTGEHYRSDWTPPTARGSPNGYVDRAEKSKQFADELTGKTQNGKRTDIIDIN